MDERKRFLEQLDLSTRQAGAVAIHLQGKVEIEAKPEESSCEGQALTAVDLATQDLILHQLLTDCPDVAVDAEEQTQLLKQFAPEDGRRPLIVLDPVDGTYNYTQGSPQYAVMAGLIIEGVFQAALIRYPTRNQTYWATRHGGCFVQSDAQKPEAVKVETRAEGKRTTPPILLSPGVSEAKRRGLEQRYKTSVCRCSAFDGACLPLRTARASVAEGRADRRRAIALFLSLEAGGVVTMGGQDWQGEDPQGLSTDRKPTICAENRELAVHLQEAWNNAP